jgi:hypothetical protein
MLVGSAAQYAVSLGRNESLGRIGKMEFIYAIDMLPKLPDRLVLVHNTRVPIEEEVMHSRAPVHVAGRRAGSLNTMQPLRGLCDELAIYKHKLVVKPQNEPIIVGTL